MYFLLILTNFSGVNTNLGVLEAPEGVNLLINRALVVQCWSTKCCNRKHPKDLTIFFHIRLHTNWVTNLYAHNHLCESLKRHRHRQANQTRSILFQLLPRKPIKPGLFYFNSSHASQLNQVYSISTPTTLRSIGQETSLD